MNKSYKTIYNTHTQTWVAVSEITVAQGKVKSSRLGEGAGSVARLTLSAIAASVLWMMSGTAMAADAYCAGTATQTYSAAGDQVVCGQGATATGYGDVAVGVGAQATGNGPADHFGGATSLGSYSYASGPQAVALGSRARAEVEQSIAIGNDTRATGTGSVSIGGDDSGSAYSTATFTVPGYTSGRTTYRATYTAGNGSTAIAPHAQALTQGSTAVGVGATAGEGTMGAATGSAADITLYAWTPSATSIEATSIGAMSAATKAQTTAVGYKAQALADYSMVVGSNAFALGDRSVVLGGGSSTTDVADNSFAAGVNVDVTAPNAVAIGTFYGTNYTTATAQYATAIGAGSKASGIFGVALGAVANASAGNTVAIGTMTNASAGKAIAIGSQANASATDAMAQGTSAIASAIDTVAIGHGAQATIANSIALGSGSRTAIDAGVAGYDPLIGSPSLLTDSTWKATTAAVSVGDGTTITRQITSVAAGTNDTDAVNVAQLKQLAGGTITFTGNTNNDTGTDGTQQKLGSTLAITGGATGASSNTNVKTVITDGKVDVQLLDAPTFTGTVTAPTFVASGANPITISGSSGTIGGLTNTTFDPTNYVSGQAATEDQLASVSETASKGWNLTTAATGTGVASGTTLSNVAPGGTVTYTAGNNIVITQKGNEVQIATSMTPEFTTVKTGNTTMDNSGITIVGGPNATVKLTNAGLDNGGNTITNVKAGVNDTDAVNMAQLNEVKGIATQKTTVTAADTNVKVTATKNSTGGTDYAVGLADKVTIGSDSATAVTVDGTTGTVKAGSVTVNGSAGTIGGLTNKTFDVNNYVSGQAATEDQLAQVANNLNTLASKHTTVKAGSNTVVAEGTNAAGGKEYTVSVSDDLNLKSATFTDAAGNKTVVNGAGSTMTDTAGNSTTTSASGVKVTNGTSTVSLTAGGLDNGGNKITNVAAGTADTDAVNVGQLNTALNNVNQTVVNLGNKVEEVGKESKAGTASAIATANLPQATIPGMGMTTVGLGTYDGQSAIAVGLSKMSDNGKWVIKASATTNTQGKVGAGVGVGFHW